jgi:hypothetical protein
LIAVGEERARAGDVLFGFDGIDLEIGFAILVGDGEKTNAMNRTGGASGVGIKKAHVVCEEVRGVDKEKKRNEGDEDTSEECVWRAQRAFGSSGHGAWARGRDCTGNGRSKPEARGGGQRGESKGAKRREKAQSD